ncbi:MAG TPA: ankyrin repeat domain-containing protein [Isosphaeraceae bacterium]|nr:ankyrin repeat domain-containing protein [Isosphaeraceae bacterium]
MFESVDSQLTLAIFENDRRRVSAYLAQGGDANLRGWQKQTLLFLAADKSRDQAIAEELLARGADLRMRDEHGKTPLHVAAGFGDVARMRLFLDKGAEIDARDAYGRTPLHHTTMDCRLEEAMFLVGRGADVSIRDHRNLTPLEHAREWRAPERDPLLVQRWESLERLVGGFRRSAGITFPAARDFWV